MGFFRVAIVSGVNIDQGFRRDKNGTVTPIINAGELLAVLQGLGINASGKILGLYTISTGFLATR